MVVLIGPSRLLSALFWDFYFYYMCFQHLLLLGKYWGLCAIIEGSTFDFLCPTFFWRRLRSCWLVLSHCNLCAICWGFSSDQYIWRSPLMLLGCWYMPARLSESWWYTCPLLSLRDRGSKVIGRTASRLQAFSWEVFSLPYVFVVPWRRRGQIYIIPFSLISVLLYPYLLIMWERDN